MRFGRIFLRSEVVWSIFSVVAAPDFHGARTGVGFQCRVNVGAPQLVLKWQRLRGFFLDISDCFLCLRSVNLLWRIR